MNATVIALVKILENFGKFFSKCSGERSSNWFVYSYSVHYS